MSLGAFACAAAVRNGSQRPMLLVVRSTARHHAVLGRRTSGVRLLSSASPCDSWYDPRSWRSRPSSSPDTQLSPPTTSTPSTASLDAANVLAPPHSTAPPSQSWSSWLSPRSSQSTVDPSTISSQSSIVSDIASTTSTTTSTNPTAVASNVIDTASSTTSSSTTSSWSSWLWPFGKGKPAQDVTSATDSIANNNSSLVVNNNNADFQPLAAIDQNGAVDSASSAVVDTITKIADTPIVETIDASWLSPIGFFERALFAIHDMTGMNWVWVILSTTIGLRLLLFPMQSILWTISVRRALTKRMDDLIMYLSLKARKNEEVALTSVYRGLRKKNMEKTKHNYFVVLLSPFAMVIISMCYFWAVHSLFSTELPSMKLEGFPWAPDLTKKDPTFLTSILFGLSTAMVTYVSFTRSILQRKMINYASQGAFLTFMLSFGGSIFMYSATAITAACINLVTSFNHILYSRMVLPTLNLTANELKTVSGKQAVANANGIHTRGRVNQVYSRYFELRDKVNNRHQLSESKSQ